MIVYSQAIYKYGTNGGTAIKLASGQTQVCVTILATNHGRIHRVIVKQAYGTSTAFKVNVYDDDVTSSGTYGADISKIIAEQSVSAGGTCFVNSELGYPYRNKINASAFYLVISLSSPASEDLYFDAAITWATPEA